MKASLADPEYRKAWLRQQQKKIVGVFGQGYWETLEAAIRQSDDGLLLKWLPGTWTEIGWLPPDGLPEEGHGLIGEVLSFYERARGWWWGDWIAHGERKHGQTYTQAAELSGRQYDTLAGYHWTVRRFDYERRRLPPVYYSHHAKLAAKKYSRQDQDRWLTIVEQRRLSVSDLGLLLSKLPQPPPDPEPAFQWLAEWHAEQEIQKAVKKAVREGGVAVGVGRSDLRIDSSSQAKAGTDMGACRHQREVVCPGCGLIFEPDLGEARVEQGE